MSKKILFVDDDPNILAAHKRGLRKYFELDLALGGEEGIVAIRELGPYAAVVSDLRMPGMNGIEFLARVRELSPDTVRLMLTGNADLDAAMAAVNEGNIFRFLTKPVQTEMLIKALQAALEQYRLITAEHDLLQKTLSGSIKVLTDVLSLVNPIAFSRASRLKRYVRQIAVRLGASVTWQFELAAMLSQIGCVILPPDTLEKVYAAQPLSENEEKMFASHPNVAYELLVNIPRLDSVAHIIARQMEPFSRNSSTNPPKDRDVVSLGGQILKVALDFDQLISRGMSIEEAVGELQKRPGECDPLIVAALENIEVVPPEMAVRNVALRELQIRMIFDEDVRTAAGTLVVAKGQEVTFPVLEHLRRFAQTAQIAEPVRVLVPHYPSEEKAPSRKLQKV